MKFQKKSQFSSALSDEIFQEWRKSARQKLKTGGNLGRPFLVDRVFL